MPEQTEQQLPEGATTVPVTALQARMLDRLDAEVRAANQRFAEAIALLLAGHGIEKGQLAGHVPQEDGSALLVVLGA